MKKWKMLVPFCFVFVFFFTKQTVNMKSVGKYLKHQMKVVNVFSNKLTINTSYIVEDYYCKRLEKSPCNSSS